MPEPLLRPYQKAALHHVQRCLKAGERRVYVTQPPGTGKTILLARLAAMRQDLGRTLVLEHRQDLVRQTAIALREEELAVGMLMQRHHDLDKPVVVATVQSLKPETLQKWLASHESPVTTILIDEAHHAVPGSAYARIIADIEQATDPSSVVTIGFTATPFRNDEQSMLALLPTCAFERTIPEMVREGYLAPLVWQPVQIELDLEALTVQTHGGELDYDEKALAGALHQDAFNEQIVRHVTPLIEQRPTIVFAASVRHAESLADMFCKQGIGATTITGRLGHKQRERLYASWQQGEIQVVCTCALLTEGFDFPAIAAVVIARPTRSPGLYLQMLGRGMRTAEGKTNCLIIDVLGNHLDLRRQVALPDVVTLPNNPLSESMRQSRQRTRDPRTPEPGVLGTEEGNGLAVLDPIGHSPYCWVSYLQGFLAQVSPEVAIIIERDPDQSGLYRSRLVMLQHGSSSKQCWINHRYLPLRQQVDLVHEAAHPYYKASFGSKEADWAQRPATEKQLETLARLQPHLVRRARAEGWTSRRVSLVISWRWLRWAVRHPPPLDEAPATEAKTVGA